MKFITEDDLRDLYFKNPFTSYEIKDDTRLTPGARQFLIDFKIDFDKSNKINKNTCKSIEEDTFENINFAVSLKEFAYKIRKLDINFSEKLNDYSKRIYKNEKIKCEIRFKEINLKKIFLEMDLDDTNIELILEVLKFQCILNDKFDLENENIKLISNIINLWIYRKVKDGDNN